jgi:hypothetical protein
MKLLKNKKTVICLVMAIMMIFSSMTVFARGTDMAYIRNGGTAVGDVYVNVKSSSFYGETNAYNNGSLSTDFVKVRTGEGNKETFGASSKSAVVSTATGVYIYGWAEGEIRRNGITFPKADCGAYA